MRFVNWSATAQDSFLSRSERLRLLLLLWACGQRGCVVHHVHSPGAGDCLAPDRHRRAAGQRLVRASLIVEGDPSGDAARGFPTVGGAFEIDSLALVRAAQPLDEEV